MNRQGSLSKRTSNDLLTKSAKNTVNMLDVTDLLPAGGLAMNAFKTGGDIAKFADTKKRRQKTH